VEAGVPVRGGGAGGQGARGSLGMVEFVARYAVFGHTPRPHELEAVELRGCLERRVPVFCSIHVRLHTPAHYFDRQRSRTLPHQCCTSLSAQKLLFIILQN